MTWTHYHESIGDRSELFKTIADNWPIQGALYPDSHEPNWPVEAGRAGNPGGLPRRKLARSTSLTAPWTWEPLQSQLTGQRNGPLRDEGADPSLMGGAGADPRPWS